MPHNETPEFRDRLDTAKPVDPTKDLTTHSVSRGKDGSVRFISNNPINRGNAPTPYAKEDPYNGRAWKFDDAAIKSDETLKMYGRNEKKFMDLMNSENAKFDEQIKPLTERAAVLRPGTERDETLAVINKHQNIRTNWGRTTTAGADQMKRDAESGTAPKDFMQYVWNIAPNDRPYFARQLYMYERARTELPVITANLAKDALKLAGRAKNLTKDLFVNAMFQCQMYESLKSSAASLGPAIDQLKIQGQVALRAIDQLGSHMFASYGHEADSTISHGEQAILADTVKNELDKKGANSAIRMFDLPINEISMDQKGIARLLKLKSDLAVEIAGRDAQNIVSQRQAAAALRNERQYIVSKGVKDPARLDTVNANDQQKTEAVIVLARKTTDETPDSKPEEKIAAAQREKAFIESFATGSAGAEAGKARILVLDNRDPNALGVIQRMRDVQLGVLKAETNKRVEAMNADPLATLAAIRAEGKFIFKYRNELSAKAVERMTDLQKAQHDLLEQIWTTEKTGAGNDPEKMANAIATIVANMKGMGAAETNKTFLEKMQKDMQDYLLKILRPEVNKIVAGARSAAPEDAAAKDRAIVASAAERKAMDALGMDQAVNKDLQKAYNERVQSLDRNVGAKWDRANETDRAIDTELRSPKPNAETFKKLLSMIESEGKMRGQLEKNGGDRTLLVRGTQLYNNRERVMSALQTAVDASVLPSSLQTTQDVDRAKELVSYELQVKGGVAMSNAERFAKLNEYLATLDKGLSKVKRATRTKEKIQLEENKNKIPNLAKELAMLELWFNTWEKDVTKLDGKIDFRKALNETMTPQRAVIATLAASTSALNEFFKSSMDDGDRKTANELDARTAGLLARVDTRMYEYSIAAIDQAPANAQRTLVLRAVDSFKHLGQAALKNGNKNAITLLMNQYDKDLSVRMEKNNIVETDELTKLLDELEKQSATI